MSIAGSTAGGFGRRGGPTEPVATAQRSSGGGTRGGVTAKHVLAFIGHNEHKFEATVEAMAAQDPPFSSLVPSWTWPGFFVTWVWAAYRKMYGLSLAILLLVPIAFVVVQLPVAIFFSEVASDTVGAVLGLTGMVLGGVFGKAFYVKVAAKRVATLLAEEATPAAAVYAIQQRGGVSSGAAWAAFFLPIVVQVVLVIVIMSYLLTH